MGDSEDFTKIKIDVDPLKQLIRGVTAHGNIPFEAPYMSEIAPNLWQGGCKDGLILPRFIKHLVSLYPWEKYKIVYPLDTHMTIRMFDSVNQATDQIDAIAKLVDLARDTGPVLVHCQAGLNRSSLVVARALKYRHPNRSGAEIIELIRTRRSPAALCNETFESYVRNL